MSILFALFSALSFGFSPIFMSKTVRGYNLLFSLVIRSFLLCLFSILAWFIFDRSSTNIPTFLIILGISFIGYVSLVFRLKAFQVGKIGVVAPIIQSNSLVTAILAIILFNERVTLLKILGVIMVIGGTFILTVNLRDIKNTKIFKLSTGIPYAFLTFLFIGVAFTFWGYVTMAAGVFMGMFIIELGNLVFSSIHLLSNKAFSQNYKFNIKLDKILIIFSFLSASVGFLGGGFRLLALSGGEIAQISVIASSTSLFNVLFARIFLNEKLNLQQYLAILIMVCGIASLSLN